MTKPTVRWRREYRPEWGEYYWRGVVKGANWFITCDFPDNELPPVPEKIEEFIMRRIGKVIRAA